MRKITVSSRYNNKRLVDFLLLNFPSLNRNLIYKTLRKKDIRVNNVKISENINVFENDEISIYLTDDVLFKTNFKIEKIYEDENILIVNKPKEIEVVSYISTELTLTKVLENDYNYIKPCHRLDRNTSGLVVFAKDEQSLSILLEKFKNKEIKKTYTCIVWGILDNKQSTLHHYLFKDRKKSIVYISSKPQKGYLEIITKYRVISEDKLNNISKLEVELVTGRTHQIRAHLAYIGHPIIGDGKYGINEVNKKFGEKYQLLEASKISFDFSSPSDKLDYLNKKTFFI